MEFILYFVFRRFFVSLQTDRGVIRLRKGLVFRRFYDIPISAITCVSVKRSPALRLLRGRRITLRTLSGKESFYLRDHEFFELFPAHKYKGLLRPRCGSVALAALCSTRMLGGTVVFATTISRIGSVFGSGYYDGIISAIEQTAGGLSELLHSLRITVPHVTTVLAVFAAAAWAFAFLRNLLRFSRFRLRLGRGSAVITHGIITLYEQQVVSDNLGGAVTRENASALLFGAAPLYCHGVMLVSPLKRSKLAAVMRAFLGISRLSADTIKPPRKALFGHIGVPFWWAAGNAAALLLYRTTGSDPTLRTLLWGGLGLSLWYCLLYWMYMRRSGLSRGNDGLVLAARKGTAMYTVFIPQKAERIRIDRNPFQLKSGLCDVKLFCRGRISLRLRNIYHAKLSGLL